MKKNYLTFVVISWSIAILFLGITMGLLIPEALAHSDDAYHEHWLTGEDGSLAEYYEFNNYLSYHGHSERLATSTDYACKCHTSLSLACFAGTIVTSTGDLAIDPNDVPDDPATYEATADRIITYQEYDYWSLMRNFFTSGTCDDAPNNPIPPIEVTLSDSISISDSLTFNLIKSTEPTEPQSIEVILSDSISISDSVTFDLMESIDPIEPTELTPIAPPPL